MLWQLIIPWNTLLVECSLPGSFLACKLTKQLWKSGGLSHNLDLKGGNWRYTKKLSSGFTGEDSAPSSRAELSRFHSLGPTEPPLIPPHPGACSIFGWQCIPTDTQTLNPHPKEFKKLKRKDLSKNPTPTLQQNKAPTFQRCNAPLSTQTCFWAGNTALYFPVISPCFSVCRTRGSDYWSPGWIPTRLGQTQGIVCPWSDHRLLFGVAGNPDICEYFTHQWHLGEGSNFLKRVSRNQIGPPACFLYALEIYYLE